MKNNRHRTREQKKRTHTIVLNILAGISVAFGIWVFLSWMDIAFHNSAPEPVYQAWNLIDMILS